MFPQDEVVKGVISGYVFEQFEVACYTSLLTAAQKVNDHDSIADLESILAEERGMAEWLLQHIPDITEQYIIRSETPGFDAKGDEAFTDLLPLTLGIKTRRFGANKR